MTFDCPVDLVRGEELELYEIHLAPHKPIYAIYEGSFNDLHGMDVHWVKLHRGMNGIFPIDPTVTKWRRVAAADQPKKPSGAWCSDKFCPIRFFEYAEQTPNFKCYSCRTRG